MTRILTFTCPCGYVFEEHQVIKRQVVKGRDGSKVEDVVMDAETVKGDAKYSSFFVLTNYTSRR
jgi:hypothetical protein